MKKELFSRIFVGLLGGIVISYLITIGISLAIGDGSYYSCVPSLIERFGNEVTAIIIQTVLSAVLGAGFAGASVIWEIDKWSLLKQTNGQTVKETIGVGVNEKAALSSDKNCPFVYINFDFTLVNKVASL